MIETVFDIEADNLLDKITRVHVVSYVDTSMEEPKSLFDYDKIVEFFAQDRIWIGHNIIGYDLPALKKVLGIPPPKKIVDTLPLARALMPSRRRYGLEQFGEGYGVQKPEITDWNNLTKEEYQNRCQEDVKINWRLWTDLRRKLGELYETSG